MSRLSLFGSILTDCFGPESDVDMLVEFQPDADITYFDLVGMEMELTKLVGRKVDLALRLNCRASSVIVF